MLLSIKNIGTSNKGLAERDKKRRFEITSGTRKQWNISLLTDGLPRKPSLPKSLVI